MRDDDLRTAIRARLKRSKMSEQTLADGFAISQPMVAEILSGVRKIPEELHQAFRWFASSGRFPSAEELAHRHQSRAGR